MSGVLWVSCPLLPLCHPNMPKPGFRSGDLVSRLPLRALEGSLCLSSLEKQGRPREQFCPVRGCYGGGWQGTSRVQQAHSPAYHGGFAQGL